MFSPLSFNLQHNDFRHKSMIHGRNHVYRVMCHVLVLGQVLEMPRERNLAFFSAVIHDLARKHDGLCYEHGQWAVEEKLSLFMPQFIENDLAETDLPEIKMAVIHHAKPQEISKTHPFYPTTALLKDADGLDRVRLFDLNTKYLRFPQTIDYVDFAQNLYDATNDEDFPKFKQFVEIAEKLLGRKIKLN